MKALALAAFLMSMFPLPGNCDAIKTQAVVLIVVPSTYHYSTKGSSSQNCTTSNDSIDCKSSSTPPQTFIRMGYAIRLQLADGRFVDASCIPGAWPWSSSCLVPDVSAKVDVEFTGDTAKLNWSETHQEIKSIDRTEIKTVKESEKYKITAIYKAGSVVETNATK